MGCFTHTGPRAERGVIDNCSPLARLHDGGPVPFARTLLIGVAVLFTIQACGPGGNKTMGDFQIHPDFQIELVASEPVVFDPVDLAFDEQGRAYVIEMPGYPFPTDTGRVVILHDDDGDGVFEKRTVFAEGFPVASSILPYRGGLLVASPPDLLFLKDTDGDDVADLRQVLLTGFIVGNTQHNYNGLTHGLDNWIYGANGGNSGSQVTWPGHDTPPIPLRRDDFRFDLDRRLIEPIGRSSGGFEITFDNWGRLFETHNLRHILHQVFPGRYAAGLPARRLGQLDEISDHEEGGLARIFAIGVQIMRVNHPEQAGYFSGASGITAYGGGAFPDEFDGNIFVVDVVLNLVHRDVLRPAGASFIASRGRERVEFLASTDRSFRPVNMTVGPDGALYLIDMHRDVIEHPEWIPDEIEAGLDLDAGRDQGRIYRITPNGGLPRVSPRFDRSDLDGVVASLGHRNKWWRDTAQRLLVQWRDEKAVEPLERLFETSPNPLARLHSLWTLQGLQRLDQPLLLQALRDSHPGVREHAAVIAEEAGAQPTTILAALLELADDPDGRVRMQAALTLGLLVNDSDDEISMQIQAALLTIVRQDVADPWTRRAVAAGLTRRPLPMIASLLAERELLASEGARELLQLLAQTVGQKGDLAEIAAVLQSLSIDEELDRQLVATTFQGLARGMRARSGSPFDGELSLEITTLLERQLRGESLPVVRAAWQIGIALGVKTTPRQQQLLEKAAEVVIDQEVATERRMEHLALLEFAEFPVREHRLYALLDTRHPKALQVAAIDQLSRVDPSVPAAAGSAARSVASRILSLWKTLGPDVRGPAGNILLYRRENHELLLTALEQGEVTMGELNLHLERRRVLLHSRDPEIQRRAEALFTDAGIVTRKAALERMRPALNLQGRPKQGHEIYTELCAKCHRLGNEGVDLGPNLTEVFRKSAESLMHDIIDPNAAVETAYISYTVETRTGALISGIVARETDATVTIREALNKETTIRRDEIDDLYSTGLSIMPEELEDGMSPQTMADLIAFLQQHRH